LLDRIALIVEGIISLDIVLAQLLPERAHLPLKTVAFVVSSEHGCVSPDSYPGVE
jgi:hypothetical protein